ncbi:hypothetical protein ILUMI_02523 [Ignelater luminosus]|uniref:Uncharacterized protein n=1 Tax=Ignelater luminosus TaxID=2038154 RepID=A0A8K0DGB0_IGNLU|nr:hypothetical protein ILUMI_02523 [Ignelater luminosus]
MCAGEDEAIIAAYGPNKDATVPEKGQFFNQLQETIDEYRGNVMVMEDLNGRMGSNNVAYEEVGVMDVGVRRGMELGTDNYFLEVKLKMLDGGKVANRNCKKRPVNREPKFEMNYCKLRSPEVREEFIQAVEQEVASQAEVRGEARLVKLWKAFK